MAATLPLSAQPAANADALFKQGDWTAACAAYKRLHRQEPNNHVYTYRYARCLGELGQSEKAIELFETVTNITLRDYFLAIEYMKLYRFREALTAIDTYLAAAKPESERYDKALQIKTAAEIGARWLAKTEDVLIYAVEEAPVASWRDSLRLGKDAGTISPDGSYTTSLGDRTIYCDSLHHLYTRSRLVDEWSEPEQLPFSGQNPFLASDGITIYYSTTAEDGLGGSDLYMSRLNTATHTYLQPTMLGMPFSSTSDDLFYGVDDLTGQGVFVSRKDEKTVLLYRFIAGDEKQFMRGQDEASIRQMAMRKTIRQPKPDAQNVHNDEEFASYSPMFTQEDSVPASAFRFVLNDSTVYTSLPEFRSDKARMLCRRLLAAQKELDHKSRELDKQRKTYNTSESAEERQCLVPVIMNLEKETAALRQEIAALPGKIRLAEQAK